MPAGSGTLVVAEAGTAADIVETAVSNELVDPLGEGGTAISCSCPVVDGAPDEDGASSGSGVRGLPSTSSSISESIEDESERGQQQPKNHQHIHLKGFEASSSVPSSLSHKASRSIAKTQPTIFAIRHTTTTQRTQETHREKPSKTCSPAQPSSSHSRSQAVSPTSGSPLPDFGPLHYRSALVHVLLLHVYLLPGFDHVLSGSSALVPAHPALPTHLDLQTHIENARQW